MLVYRKKSKIFVLINCKTFAASLQEHSTAIGSWMALIESSLRDDHPDLRKKTADLARDMKQAHFTVTENEERVHCTLQKEGQGRPTKKAVQNAIIMDLARALGIDSNDLHGLKEQVKLLKNDLECSSSVTARRILLSLERILDNWSVVPPMESMDMGHDFEEEAHILPFKNFLCPLTKEVMKDPVVVLESSQNYERTAIQYWFERCQEDCRDPTCPVTGQVLKSLVIKPNIGLAGAIEEWVNRNIEIQVKSAVDHLSREPPVAKNVEKVLEIVYKISKEHPSSRFTVRNAGIPVLIIKLLKNFSDIIDSFIRSKALMTLLSMANDEDSKKIMLEEGITRLAIHGLVGSSENEREYAVKLLVEFSGDESYCIKLASEKGALVLLASMAGDLENPSLSNLAEEVLKRLERVEANTQQLAAAGRFEPLLSRLHNGSSNDKIEMASMIGSMALTKSCKEQIARRCSTVLIELLSLAEGRLPSLQALQNLSGLDDNAIILVDSAVLPGLTDVLFQDNGGSFELKELAASTIANIVSNPGHWELAAADKKGNLMQSESVVFSFLGLLSATSLKCQASILHILYGIASSPQAAESVATHIKSYTNGIESIIAYLEHPEVEPRLYAFRLTRLLAERLGHDMALELKSSNKLPLLKDKLLDNQSTESEKSDAAGILANLPLSEEDVKTLLGSSFLKWTVAALSDQQKHHKGRISRSTSSMVEGLLGLLLHFTKSLDQEMLSLVKEYHLMTIFSKQLRFPSRPRLKQLAVAGLKNLSEAGRSLAAIESEPLPPQGFCAPLVFICGTAPPNLPTCPIHGALCDDRSHLCLLKNNCVKPLLDLLTDDNTEVQIAAVEALSTLLVDSTSNGLRKSVDELEQLGISTAMVDLFIDIPPGVLQERTLWMIKQILTVDAHAQRHSLNQGLVRALVEAFKHGNANSRQYARDALTNLKQISGTGGKPSQSRPRR